MAQSNRAGISRDMERCAHICHECHDVCLETVQHCLRLGAEHAAPDHIRLLMDCQQICHTSEDFMHRGSDLHHAVCGVCAMICERCAEDCERIGGDDDVMRRCARKCRECAEACREMAGSVPAERTGI